MTEPRENEPMGPDDVAELAGLDLALDELAAGRDVQAEGADGGQRALATLAAELREAVPAPPTGAAERGRAAFLATAAAGRGQVASWRRRSLPLRLAAVAAALVVLVALPAAARQARPGETLWPVRELGQAARDRLADDPVHRAQLRLNTAASYLQEAGAAADEEAREDMADQAEERIEAALEALEGVAGPSAAAERARAGDLLLQVEALERRKDADDRSGSGSGSGPGEDRSGPGGADDRSGSGGGDDDPSGGDGSGKGGDDGGDDDGGSGSGSSGSGSGSSGSNRSGSGDD